MSIWSRYMVIAALMAQTVKNLPTMWENWVRSLDWENPLEKGMITQSRPLAWRIPWTGSLVIYRPWGHTELDMTEWLSHTHTHTQTHSCTQSCYNLGDVLADGQESLACCSPWVTKSWTQLSNWTDVLKYKKLSFLKLKELFCFCYLCHWYHIQVTVA